MIIWVFNTRAGTAKIVPDNGGFQAVFNDDGLGWYSRPDQAAEDMAGGHTFSPSCGTDLSKLGIPEDVSRWTKLRID